MVLVLLLWSSLARAGEPAGAAELQARVERFDGLTLDGPAPGQVLSREEEDQLLLGQLQVKAKALQEIEREAIRLIADGDPANDVLAVATVAEAYLGMAEAIEDAASPRYLTADQREIYQMSQQDIAFKLRMVAQEQVSQLERLLGPDLTEEEELDLWLLRYRTEPTRPPSTLARCVVPYRSHRERKARETLERARVSLDHLRVDLETWGGCLPAAELEPAQMVLEQAQPVVDEQDVGMILEVMPFLDEIEARLHEALPAACGVSDHRREPVAGLDLPPPPCQSSPRRDAVLARLDTMEAEDAALGPAPTPAARRALATRWLQTSHELFLLDPFWMGDDTEADLHVRGALIAVDRASRHLQRARAAPELDAEERARVVAAQAEVLRWWAFLWAIFEGRPIDRRKYLEY